MLAIEYLPHYTYEDYKQWEGEWELIDGIAYAMRPRPMKKHQYILNKITFELEKNIKNCKECFILPEAEWHIGDDSIFVPDIMVVCNEDLEGAYVENTPSIIFEILSKSTAKKDKELKKLKYQEAGVKYYIIVDGDLNQIESFELKEDEYINKKINKFKLDNCEIDFDFGMIF